MSRKRATEDGDDTDNGLTDLPPLPAGWCWTTLEEIAEIEGGITKDQKRRMTSSTRQVPYLRVANVQRGFLNLTEMKTILADEREIENLRLVKGDVLFTEGGDRDKLGRGWIWNGEIEDCIHQNHIFRARLGLTFVEPKFVSYHGNHFGQEWFTKAGKQTTNLASINKSILRRFPVPLAPFNEQRRIVAKLDELLSDLDAGLSVLEEVRAKLKSYRASVLKAAIEGKLTQEWREKHPDAETGSALLDRILDERRSKWEEQHHAKSIGAGKQASKGWIKTYAAPIAIESLDLPILPPGWAWTAFDAVLSEPLRNGHSAKASPNGLGIRTLTLTAVTLGDFSEKNTKVTVARPEDVHDLWLQPGDLLIERSNTAELVGTSRLYRGAREFAIYPDLLIRARTCQAIDDRYIEAVLQASSARKYLRSRAKGLAGSMPKIDQGTILSLPIPLPPAAEQSEIAKEVERRLSIVDEIEAQVEANRKRAIRLRQSILKRAFEGKLVPQDPDDEPADRLLERIRGGVAEANLTTTPLPPRRKVTASNGPCLPFMGPGEGDPEAF